MNPLNNLLENPMKRWIVSGLVSVLMSLPAWAALQAGDTAPDFTLQASLNGKAFAYSLKAQLQKGVLFPQKLGRPDQLASMVLECITNSYMNAETIRVDGGIRMPPK